MSAEFRELPTLLLPLVNRFYKANGHKGKAKGNERVFVLEQNSNIVAALRACPEENGYWLRSVWVALPLRGQKLGSQLLKQAVLELSPAPSWCYPYDHLKKFYLQSGFKEIALETTPDSIQSRYLTYCKKQPELLLMIYKC